MGSIEAGGKVRRLTPLALIGLAFLMLAAMAGTASAATVSTPTASEILSGSARVSASVDTEGNDVYAFVEYSSDGVHWQEPPANGLFVPGDDEPSTVSVKLTGLHAQTKYFVRFYVEGFSPLGEFTTLSAAPPTVVAINPPTEVTNSTAFISGSVERPAGSDPGLDAICQLEYIADAVYSQQRDEEQRLTITATGGTFTLSFGEPAQTTGSLPFNASAAEVQSALEALSSIGSGAVAVSGVPEDLRIAFGGSLADQNLPQIGVDSSGLTVPGEAYGEITTLTEGRAEGWEGASTAACEPARITSAGVSPVDIALSGLAPNTAYRYRLTASNSGGSDTLESASTFTTEAVPLAQTLGTGAIQPTAVTLSGRVDPANAAAVTYQFEWGLTTAYGNFAPAAPELLPFNDATLHPVSAAISGLQEGTTYHYRLVATNSQTGDVSKGIDRSFSTPPGGSSAACPNESSRVGPSAGLPDCRAYEWATPDINGISTLPEGGISAQALADGSAIKIVTTDAPDQAEGSTINQPTISERGPDGWHSHSLGALSPEPVETFAGLGAEGLVSADFEESLFYTSSPITGDRVRGEANLYLRRADNTAVPITLLGTKINGESQQFPIAVGQDQASEDFSHIFYRGLARQLPEDPLAFDNTYDWSERNQTEGHLKLLGILPAEGGNPEAPAPNGATYIASSRDGEFVLFVASGFPGLYLRIHGEETVEVSASQRETPEPGPVKNVNAVGISSDGSTVLFTSSSELTDDANTGEFEGDKTNEGSDLYSYDVATGVLSDLTADHKPSDSRRGANVTGVQFKTKDASFVYFNATGDLAEGAVPGAPNLYVEHEGTIRYVSPAAGVVGSPDGLHAALVSTDNLTNYDSEGQTEIYRYSYEGGSIDCASCRPSGLPPSAGASVQGRAISKDGARVFFTSEDAVLPGTASGRARAYEYSAGKVSLLSPADATAPVYLVNASESGDDVFLGTYEELVPGAGHNFAVYDARVDADTFVASPPQCDGEACRGAGSAAPGGSAIGSAGFQAPGELTAPRSKVSKSKRVELRISVPDGGRLTVSGVGVKTARKTVAKAGAVTVTVTLTPAANKKRLKKGVFRTKARVLFKPAAGAQSPAARQVVALTFHSPSKKGGK